MVRKGQFVGLDWNCIARIRSQVMTGTCELTNSIALLRHLSHKNSLTVAQWLEHLTRSRRVVGSNPIRDPDFSKFAFLHVKQFTECLRMLGSHAFIFGTFS